MILKLERSEKVPYFCLIPIRNYIILKQFLNSPYFSFCLIPIRNYIILKQTTETYKNKSYLNSFKKEVDKLDSVEKKLIVSAGVTALSTMAAAAAGAGAIFTGGTLSPAAWTSIAATAGAGAVSFNLLLEYDRICKDAYYYYMRVWNLK
ncbi:geobacillin-26 family protein [Helcococcus bovis]|uniref:geobacillin-26 family protein n=1 Tax=Helcococcus bovis TaxID=3153252 RepID=UPI0038B8FD2F